MNPFLRRVLEVRHTEQMEKAFESPEPVKCVDCGLSYTPKPNSDPERCFTCRLRRERAEAAERQGRVFRRRVRLTHTESTGKDLAL